MKFKFGWFDFPQNPIIDCVDAFNATRKGDQECVTIVFEDICLFSGGLSRDDTVKEFIEFAKNYFAKGIDFRMECHWSDDKHNNEEDEQVILTTREE